MAGPPDPDCPDCPDPQEAGTALLPREPKELAQVLSSATNTLFGGIEAAHVSDLLGRRGFANMLLSDTLAMPYTIAELALFSLRHMCIQRIKHIADYWAYYKHSRRFPSPRALALKQ